MSICGLTAHRAEAAELVASHRTEVQFDRVRVEQLLRLRPFAITSAVLDPVSTDDGVEQLVIATSKEMQLQRRVSSILRPPLSRTGFKMR